MNDADRQALARSMNAQPKRQVESLLTATPIPAAERPAWTTEAQYRTAREIVRDRSSGLCEANTPECRRNASQVHHKAGRGFVGCHHPDLLLAVCGMGNVDGCHGYIHADRKRAEAAGWMHPHGTTADDLLGDAS